MKLQHVSVMFIIIFIPIIIVTSYFINLQVKTIKLETSYNEKLLNATYDAMTAFELNTANEDLSSVSDSLRSIIDASNNIFFNTLCTNFGVSNASKSYVQPYIPAILYTLYDGYYIYSPTNIPQICVDKYGRTIRTSDYGVKYKSNINGIGIYQFDNDAIKYNADTPTEPDGLNTGYSGFIVKYNELDKKEEYGQILYKNKDGSYSTQLHTFDSTNDKYSTYYKRDYILKSYIPYSANYFNDRGTVTDLSDDINITVNYTLDNFLTIEGTIGEIYYTKSGYLISNDLISSIIVDGTAIDSWKKYSEDILDSYIYDPSNHEIIVNLNDGVTISNRDGFVKINLSSGGTEDRYWDDAQSAVEYYVDSYIFSSWIYENFNELEANDLRNTQYSVSDIKSTIDDAKNINDTQTNLLKNMLYNFSGDKTKIFDSSSDNNPESEESFFYKHKRNVIKNSITYNLILSMIVYTEESRTVEFSMPVLEENEWNMILNNVSIISFMQGMRCGLKYYNNYTIVTSTNNEISIDDNEIYYVPRDVENGNILTTLGDDIFETAHRIDCENLQIGTDNNFWKDGLNKTHWLGCISFKSKEIKYDKILNKDGSYTYDHMAYTDYDCIVDSNYSVKNVNNTKEDGNTDVLEYLLNNVNSTEPSIDTNLQNQLKYKLSAYRIAIAKERNNLYKTTAFPENYGWQVKYLADKSPIIKKNKNVPSVNVSLGINKDVSEIKKIELTINNTQNQARNVYTDKMTISFGTGNTYSQQVFSVTSKSRNTLEFIKDFESGNANTLTISTENINTSFDIESIKIYYK